MPVSAGITAIGVYFPPEVRTNAHWRERVPDLIDRLEQRLGAQVWEATPGAGNPWQRAMAPYLNDVFRGSQERRVMGAGETAHTMEIAAARRVLDAAGLTPADIDVVLVSSFFPDQYVVGDAAGLALAMGFTCPCYNIESACGVAVADLVMGCALVESGRARRVLVVTACTYSRSLDDDNPMSWTSGDGASAFVIGAVPEGYGLLGAKSFTTLESVGSFDYHFAPDPVQAYRIKVTATRIAGEALERSVLKYLPEACAGAMAASGLTEVDFAIFPTAAAWFVAYARDALGLPADRTIDTYPRFANTGPVLMPQNLYYAAAEGRVKAGDRVLLFSMGSVSTCGAAVIRLGDLVVAPDA